MLTMEDKQITRNVRRLTGRVALALVVLGVLGGLATFLVLTGLTPIRPDSQVTTALLIGNAVLVVIMAVLVLGQVAILLYERTRGTPGAGLHIRLISLFSVIAVVPAIVVALFASVTLNRGLDAWFSERTRAIVDGAVAVAEANIQNAADNTRSDTASIAADLAQQYQMYQDDRQGFVRRVARHAAIRSLVGAFVFNAKEKQIDANVTVNENVKFLAPSQSLIDQADKGELVVIPPGQGGNLVRALIKLQNFPSHYLYIYRVIPQTVVEQLAKTREAKDEYDRMMRQRVGVQLTFGLVFALVAMVFLLAAIWLGLWFSDRLVAPLVRLLGAARQVAEGNLGAKVSVLEGPGDIQVLSRTFNLMTDQIRHSRDELVATNEQLDDRRRFTEAMLAGVSAGVIGVGPDNRVTLINRSALSILSAQESDFLGQGIDSLLPEFSALFEQAKDRASGSAEGQVNLEIDGSDRNFSVRITTEASAEADHGYVLTFDDITNLVSAQRTSAWADIARRIAHEIKNPLTPIQLSAERLKRKYGKDITTDREVFEQCISTIIRQVGDIGRMVDEFSSFARMPKAVPEPNGLAETVRDATMLQRVSASDMDISLDPASQDTTFPFDRRLVTQAVTNLVKNAREAIEGRGTGDDLPRGAVEISYGVDQGHPFVRVIDNGVGLPKENRHRLTEPYMTTREKGTGLGLAIVKRIMEEHGGDLLLADAPSGQGAAVTLRFPIPHHHPGPAHSAAPALH